MRLVECQEQRGSELVVAIGVAPPQREEVGADLLEAVPGGLRLHRVDLGLHVEEVDDLLIGLQVVPISEQRGQDVADTSVQPGKIGSAVLVQAHDEWQVSDRCYLSEGSMAALTASPTRK